MTASVPTIWKVGDIILDQYEVTDVLGQGGMGIVHKVHHRGWNIDLAVKSPKPEVFTREGGKENFIREAETWVNLNLHPHIVTCYYVRTLGNIPSVFAEYVAGKNLASWIRDRRLYEGGPEQALARMLDITIQFAWGLHAAHEQGLVHQDVKPANVMLTPDGIAKVTDFGLARARTMAGEVTAQGYAGQSIVVPGAGLMTKEYASPEQMRGEALTRKTDIWSWAVSVLHLFVGGVTWLIGAIAREALARHTGQDKGIPAMSAELVKLLARCFEPRPEDRPANMLEVAAALQEIYAHEIGHPYLREAPQPVEMLADSLNNRALSLYDLGKVEEAKQVWNQALQADPHHLEATYNRGLVLWRTGELTDEILVRQLEEVETTQEGRGQVLSLLAQVHLERGDREVARGLLEEATQQALEETEVQVLLKQVQSGNFSRGNCLHTFEGHTGTVTSVSLSTDGRLALSSDFSETVRLWETATGDCLRTFEGHTGTVTSVSLSADGHLALSGSADTTVRLWEVASGGCLHTFEGHTDIVRSVSLSADGDLALSGSEDTTVQLWETATGNCLRIFEGHTNGVRAVSLSADGRLALSGSEDMTVRLWEVASGECLHTFKGHTSGVRAVSLSADGRRALSGGADTTVQLWETATGNCLRIFEGHTSGVRSVSLSADGHLALSGGADTTVRLWETATGSCLRTFEGHTDTVTSVSLSTDSSLALSGSEDETLQLWEVPRERHLCLLRLSQVRSHADLSQVETQATALLLQAEHAYKETDVVIALRLARQVRALPGWKRSPKSRELWRRLALQCSRGDLDSSWLARTFQSHTDTVRSVSLSADGRRALSGGADTTVRLWEVATGNCLRTFQGHRSEVTSVSLSSDGRFALSGSRDQTMRMWEVATGNCLRIFEGHIGGVRSVSLSSDGRFALSGGEDTLRLWEVATRRCLRTFEGHIGGVTWVSLSADGRLALSSGEFDQTVRLWEVATGECLRIFEGHTSGVRSVSLSVDGRLALSGSEDTTVRLWEVATGCCLQIFKGHTSGVRAVSLSADGRLALSGSSDQTMRLWEVTTGRCLRTFQRYTGKVESVDLSADGYLALSGSEDRILRLWELDWELEAHNQADWDEGASPYLETFLTQHTPYAGPLVQDGKPSAEEIQRALTHRGRPTWNEQDFQELLRQLQYAGYGWLHPEGVQRKLQELAVSWREPPPLTTLPDDSVSWQELPPLTTRLPQRVISRRTVIFGLAGLAVIGVASSGLLWLERSYPQPVPPPSVSTPIPTPPPWTTLFKGHTDSVHAVAWSPNGKRIASGSWDKTVQVWDASTGAKVLTYKGHTDNVNAVAWSPNGRHIASGSTDETVQVWDAASGGHVYTYGPYSREVNTVAWSPDGKRIASGSFDWTVQVWDATTGANVITYNGHTDTGFPGAVWAVAWSPDGKHIASGSDDWTVQVWDATTGANVITYNGHKSPVYAVAWSPDGKHIASGSDEFDPMVKTSDTTVQVWDAFDGSQVYTYSGHSAGVSAVAWSPDGKRIASGSTDWTVQVWDATTGANVYIYDGHTAGVSAVAWSPDGKRIASGSWDKTVQVWQAP